MKCIHGAGAPRIARGHRLTQTAGMSPRVPPLLTAALLLAACQIEATAATLERSYVYFTIGGTTLAEIDAALARSGPHVESTGRRHPGATRMEFNSSVTYRSAAEGCSVAAARVRLDARVTLPRWRGSRGTDARTRQVWQVLEADIRRHEDQHVTIAQRYAAELERQLNAAAPRRDCAAVERDVKRITDRVLRRHDAAQMQFDRVESRDFERRISTLLGRRRPGG